MKIPAGVRIDSPSFPLLQAHISYWGITTAAGNALGTTLVDALCSTAGLQPSYVDLTITLLSGNAAGQSRVITTHTLATGTIGWTDPFTDYNGAVYQVPAGTRFCILSVLGVDSSSIITLLAELSRPALNLYEGWQDLLIDNTVWTITDPATGVAWTPAVAGAFIECAAVPNANETARLVGDQLWQIPTGAIATQEIIKRTIIEFEGLMGNVANIDNTLFFLGFSPNQADTRASNNIIGFALIGDALQTVTDLAGVETVNTGFGETLTQHNKLKIDITDTQVRFYLNEALIATHITNLPSVPCYPNFFIDTEAGGAATLSMRIIRIWTKEA